MKNTLQAGDKVMVKRLPWDAAVEATVSENQAGAPEGWVRVRFGNYDDIQTVSLKQVQ